MKTIIKGIHMEVTPAIQEYLEKRLLGVEKFLSDTALIEAELGRTSSHHRSGDIFKVVINVKIDGDLVRAVSERDDLYTAIDDAREELKDILSSRKDKKQTLWRKGHQKVKDIMKGVSGK